MLLLFWRRVVAVILPDATDPISGERWQVITGTAWLPITGTRWEAIE